MEKNQIYENLNKAYFSENSHEKQLLKQLPALLKEVKIFVDIGSSLGQYTLAANKYMKAGEVYSIEADPIRFEELQRNCHKWESLSKNKLIAMHAAASDKDGKIEFYITNSSISGGLFKRGILKNKVVYKKISVNCLRLDKLFNDSNRPDFVKIDVEGSELRVLKGAQQILKEGKTKFLIEVHSWADPEGQKNAEEVFNFMKSFGYRPVNFYGKPLFVKTGIFYIKYTLRSFCRSLKEAAVRRMTNFLHNNQTRA